MDSNDTHNEIRPSHEESLSSTEGATPPPTAGEHSLKPVVGIVIIVIILALGGYYMWSTQVQDRLAPPVGTESAQEGDGTLRQLETQSSSDSLSDIEADLGATDLDVIDAELENLEAELNAL